MELNKMEVWMRMIEKTLAEIVTKLDAALRGIDDHEVRLRALECKPGKRWEDAVTQIITLLVAAGAGLLLGKLF